MSRQMAPATMPASRPKRWKASQATADAGQDGLLVGLYPQLLTQLASLGLCQVGSMARCGGYHVGREVLAGQRLEQRRRIDTRQRHI
jgi:hypothetical protein